jgi:iron complex outermembrane receptor protein
MHAQARFSLLALVLISPVVWAASQKHSKPTIPDPDTLDTIVVTAEKHPEAANKIPRSLSVFSSSDIANARAKDPGDLAPLVPNMSRLQSGGVGVLFLRGLGGGGRNIGFDPRVGVYLDGVSIGQAPDFFQPLFGIDQAVVLRGPQGHLFGRNAETGAVVLTTLPPPVAFDGSTTITSGSRGLREGSVQLGGPISGNLSAQAGINTEHRDGLVQNTNGGPSLDNRNRTSARAQLHMETRHLGQFDLFVDGARIDENSLVGVPTSSFFGLSLAQPFNPYRVSLNTTPFSRVSLSGTSLSWHYQDSNDRTWSATAAHRTSSQDRASDTDYSAADLVSTRYRDRYTVSSVEARVSTSQSKPSRLLLGVYLASETGATDRAVRIGQDVMSPIGLPGGGSAPFGVVFGLHPGLAASANGQVRTRTLATFGSWDRDLGPHWTTHAGARLSREEKKADFTLDGTGSGNLKIGSLNNWTDQRSETHGSLMAGLSYMPRSNLHFYATAASGYKSGGWNLDFLNQTQAAHDFSFRPEHVASLDVGVKATTIDGRGSLGAAVFNSRVRDFQVFQFVPLGSGASVLQMTNAASARSRGIEVEGSWKFNKHLEISGYATRLDARFTSFPDAGSHGEDFAGHDLPQAPRQSASLSSTLRWQNKSGARWSLAGSSRYRSASFVGASSAPTERLAPRTTFDARLSYAPASNHWDVALWGKNLSNKQVADYRARDFFGHQVQTNLDPISVGVDYTLHF